MGLGVKGFRVKGLNGLKASGLKRLMGLRVKGVMA